MKIMTNAAFMKEIFKNYQTHFYVMASLCFQMILVFVAPMRRWVKSHFMFLVIWAVYILSNFFATFALNNIYNVAETDMSDHKIFVFWAPFLLLHLGGPNTITALAMEDNNLWHRHMLALIVQVFSVGVVFYVYKIWELSTFLLIPTLIVFGVGITKCVERTNSLHLASHNSTMRSIRKKSEDSNNKQNSSSTRREGEKWYGDKKEYEIVRKGYEYYELFRGFIIDHTFISNECGKGKEFLSKLEDVENVFQVIELELYFMYQAMFTKMIAVQYWKDYFYFWGIWRFVVHAYLVTVAVMFIQFHISKHNHVNPSEIYVTYCLLGCAIILDEIALLHLIFSEWTMIKIMKFQMAPGKVRKIILRVLYDVKKACWVNKCWSGKITQYSLIDHSLNRWWKWAEPKLDYFSLKESIYSWRHTTTVDVGKTLKKLVLDDIKRKLEKHEQETQTSSSTTQDQILPALDDERKHPQETQRSSNTPKEDGRNELRVLDEIILPFFEQHGYGTVVLILHVATEICYYGNDGGGNDDSEEKEMCRQMSEYLAYLIALEERIKSVVPGSIGLSFKDICLEEVKQTLEHLEITLKTAGRIRCEKKTRRREAACIYLMTDYKYDDNKVGVEQEKSVLCEAIELARKLKHYCNDYPITQSAHIDDDVENQNSMHKNNNKEFWKSLSRVWVGLLLYACGHCREDIYYLNRGGEFFTHVRLLMSHFGPEERLKGQRATFHLKDEIH